MPKTDNAKDSVYTTVCPTEAELSVITNNILCGKCGLTFNNEPRYRMHDARVHKKITLEKTKVDNVRYHCPVKGCVYAQNSDKYFTMMKYIKQHYLKVHAEKIYPCSQCPKSFSTEAVRNAHVKVCGLNFVCACQKVFNSYEALLTHAKRSSHAVDAKYKTLTGKNTCLKNLPKQPSYVVISNGTDPIYHIQAPAQLTPVYLVIGSVPKVTCNVSVQTDEHKKPRKLANAWQRTKDARNKKTQHTQTNLIPKKKRHKKSIQTQTIKSLNKLKLASVTENIFSQNSLPLHDVGLQDYWENKKMSSTQTSEDDPFLNEDNQVNLEKIDDSSSEGYNKGVSSLDPLLTEDTYRNNLKNSGINNSSSIETQTELDYNKMFDDSDELSSYFVSSANNETQTTEDFDDFEPMHLYSNMYTQTCDDIFSTSLNLADIQTQTAYSPISETDAKLQDKEFQYPMSHHMETQTNLLHMFDDLDA